MSTPLPSTPEDEVEFERRAPSWPDLSKDNKAWVQATYELPQGTMSQIAARAQQIKEKL